jgi:hypothetical protein
MATENDEPEQEYRPLTFTVLIKAAAILFVLGIYGIIFLKILFLR